MAPALKIEFWPFGLARAGHDARTFLDVLIASGFHLTELRTDGNGPEPFDAARILAENPAHRADRHTNLILTRAG